VRLSLTSWFHGRSRALVNVSVLSLASATFVAAAATNDGFRATNVDVNDGAVWVTNAANGQVARLNIRLNQLDRNEQSQEPGVIQQGRLVFFDTGPNVARVDVTGTQQSSAGAPVDLAAYQIGGPVGAVLSADGRLWTGPSNSLLAGDAPRGASASVAAGSKLQVTAGGRVFIVDVPASKLFEVVVDPETGQIAETDVADDDGTTTTSTVAISPASGTDGPRPYEAARSVAISGPVDDGLQVSSVGDQVVVVRSDGTAGLPDRTGVAVPGTAWRIQQPGPQANQMLVASDVGLFEVSLSDGKYSQIGDAQDGPAAAPVRVGPCVYGAWSGPEPRQVKRCDERGVRSAPLPDASVGAELIFRVNQTNVALNSAGDGRVWAEVDGELQQLDLDQWNQVRDVADEVQNDQQNDASDADASQKCASAGSATPPTANQDRVGARVESGATLIDVLANDSDASCLPLFISEVVAADPASGSWLVVQDGQRVLFSPSLTAIEQAKAPAGVELPFTYRVINTAGTTSEPVTAVVTLTSVLTGPNRPPSLRADSNGRPVKMRASVRQGETLRFNALADWVDLDGDPLRLVGAATDEGEVTFTPDGVVRYTATVKDPGNVRVDITVTDDVPGVNAVTEPLEVRVSTTGIALDPIAQDDFITVVKGQTAIVHPKANDVDPNSSTVGDLTVQMGESDARTALGNPTYDPTTDTLTIANPPTAGLFGLPYLLQSSAAAPTSQSDETTTRRATVLVNVVEPAVDPQVVSPIGVPDRIVLRPGRTIDVDVLVNDVSPTGNPLAIVSTSPPELGKNGGLKVAALEHRLLRVAFVPAEDGGAPRGPFVVRYEITDGVLRDTPSFGYLTVLVDSSSARQPPVFLPDELVVRSGVVQSTNVLLNDSSPTGDKITLDGLTPESLAEFEKQSGGAAWVNESSLFVLGAKPGDYQVNYLARAGADIGGATVSIRVKEADQQLVNSAPVPVSLTLRALRGQKTRLLVPLQGIDPDGDALTLTPDPTSRDGATIAVDPSDPAGRVLEYQADAATALDGSDEFNYTVTDGLLSQAGTVRVVVFDVDAPAPPVALDDLLVARPGAVLTVKPLDNDISPDGLTLVLNELPFVDSLTGDPTGTPPAGVDVRFDDLDGAYKPGLFILTAPESGSVDVPYVVFDGTNQDRAVIRVTVDPNAPNVAPIAMGKVLSKGDIKGKTELEVPLGDYDPDASGDLVRSLPVTAADPAFAPSVNANNQIVVKPSKLPQFVVYRVNDSDPVQPLTSTAVIFVPGVENSKPRLLDPLPELKVTAGDAAGITIQLAQVLVDDDDDVAAIRLTDTPIGAGAQRLPAGDGFTFVAPATQSGLVNVEIEVRDRQDASTTIAKFNIPITVQAANQPPRVLNAGSVDVPITQDPSSPFDLDGLVSDPELDTVSFTIESTDPSVDVSTPNASNQITVTAKGNQTLTGPLTPIRLTATDGQEGLPGRPVELTINLRVVPSKRPLPVAAVIGPIDSQRGQPAKPQDVARLSSNPYPSPLKIMAVSSSTGTLSCTADCGQQPIVFTPAVIGAATVTYVIEDQAGRSATGTITYVVRDVPAAPGTPQATSVASNTVNLTWTAADMQGGILRYYEVFCIECGGAPKQSTTTSLSFDGLANGKPHTFTVRAVNELGAGASSGKSTPAIPDKVPTAPATLGFTGYASATLSMRWDASTGDFSTVDKYQVNLEGFGIIDTTALSITKSGLTNGTSYRFQVRAHNAAKADGGWGPWSAWSNTEKPSTTPSQPAQPTAVNAGDGGTSRIAVSWTAPADGGRPIESYQVCLASNGTKCLTTNGAARSVTFGPSEGIVTGTSYTFTVKAISSNVPVGTSPASPPSAATLAVTTPGVPSITGVSNPSSGQLVVSAVLSSNGGCATTGLEYSMDGGAFQTSPVFGVANGGPHTFQARATFGGACPTPASPGSRTSAASSPSGPFTAYGDLSVPIVSAQVEGDGVRLSWDATNSSSSGRAYTVSVSSSCVTSGNQTGNCYAPVGKGNTGSITVTVSAPGATSKSDSRSATVPNPPPPFTVGLGTSNSPGKRWIVGSISGGTPGAQYWIQCIEGGVFVDTSAGLPESYSARYLDGNGNGSWGTNICFNAAATTVRVWTSAGQDTTAGPI